MTYETDRQCRVEWGRWWAPYLGHHLENPDTSTSTTHGPLRNAHLSGGWNWDAERKKEYANYLEDPAHLAAISARHNRSKGARGPEEWAPPDNGLWCGYATDWTEIKQRWELTMTPVESEIVMDMLGTCEDPPRYEVEVVEGMAVVSGEDKAETESEERCTVAARRRLQPGNSESKGARAEAGDSRRRWCRARGTEMGRYSMRAVSSPSHGA